ncbi:hypothetical protein [Paenibacillus sp. y28]|uniref:hypothetical protein n=1 Tax=Paenibacillus sp. y28 TaxID=3129110 RepID=UPI003019E019
MRWSTFLLGGAVGAAAAVAVLRIPKKLMLSSLAMSKEGWTDKWSENDKRPRRQAEKKTAPFQVKTEAKPSESLADVEQFIQGDPELKRQVDEILAQSRGADSQTNYHA